VPNDVAALLRAAPVVRVYDDGTIDGAIDPGAYRCVREPDARALLSLIERHGMKKPSTQIIDIVTNAKQDIDGNAILTPAEQKQIIDLCKATDKRDQQLRAAFKAEHPNAAKKPAKKKARR